MKSSTDLQSDSKVSWVKLTHIINLTLHAHIYKHRLTGVRLLIAYRHFLHPSTYRVGRCRAVIGAEVTADCCNRNPPAGLFRPFLLLEIIQRKEGRSLVISKYVLLWRCVKKGTIYRVCLCVFIWPCLCNLPPYVLSCCCTFLHVYVTVGGKIGGPENVRNVEECNQNVLLCGKQQQPKKRKNPGR